MRIYHHINKFWLLTLIGKHLSFKSAALESGLTVSALSQNISNLEKALGKSLVERTKGEIKLTSFGAEIVNKINPILEQIDQVLPETSKAKSQYKIGAYESLAIRYFPEVLSELKTTHKDITVDISTNRTNSLLQQVKTGEIDMAFVIDDEFINGVEKEKISDVNLALYIHRDLYNNKSIYELLTQYGISMMQYDSPPFYYHHFLKNLNADYTIEMKTSSIETIVSMTKKKMCIGLIPSIIGDYDDELIKVYGTEEHGRHEIILISKTAIDHQFKNSLTEIFTSIIPG